MSNTYVQFVLKDTEGQQSEERTKPLRLPVTVGRSKRNSVRLDHIMVSKQHAKLELLSGRLILSDLNSANGTKVNDDSITSVGIKHGDNFEVGPFRITIETPHIEPLKNIVQCSNSNCQRKISSDCRSCPYCGYFCDTADTVHAVKA